MPRVRPNIVSLGPLQDWREYLARRRAQGLTDDTAVPFSEWLNGVREAPAPAVSPSNPSEVPGSSPVVVSTQTVERLPRVYTHVDTPQRTWWHTVRDGDLFRRYENSFNAYVCIGREEGIDSVPHWVHITPAEFERLRSIPIQAEPTPVETTSPAPDIEPSESDSEIMSKIEESRVTTLNSQLIGCDPEFLVLSPTKSIVPLGGIFEPDGAVGWDHGGRVAEIRPLASRSTRVIVDRIKSLLSRSSRLKKVKDFTWRAGAYCAGQPLGGHVHLPIVGENPRQIDALAAITQRLIDLDILPLEESRLRQNTEYGDLRGVRFPRDRFEYRAMPSWLFHPRVAMLSMTLAKLAALQPTEVLDTLKRNRGYKDIIRIFWNFRKVDDDARFVDESVTTQKIFFDPDRDFKGVWQESK